MKFEELHASLSAAVERLAEVLKMEKDPVVRDSAIKRFEIVFDLSWKATKAFLEERGLFCTSPKSCLQEAFRQGIVENDAQWLKILEMRNETVHTYNQLTAEEIYQELPETIEAFHDLVGRLQKNN